MTTITLNVPNKQTPGYMRRVLKSTRLQADLTKAMEALSAEGLQPTSKTIAAFADAMENMVVFVTPFVTVDEGDQRDALLDLSEDEWNALFKAVRGDVVPEGAQADSLNAPLAPASAAP